MAAALLFLVAYAIPVVDPDLPEPLLEVCSVVLKVTWAVFVVDYVARLVLSTDRRAFVRHNLLDLAVLALPALRPLRLLRLLALLAILNRAGANNLRGRVIVYVVGGTLLLVVCGSLAITDAERNQPGANIEHIGDGLWWAVSTMTTVGYGDRYPVTTTGRFIAAALMIGGIALLGVITATLASWLVQRVAEANDEEQAATRAQVDALAEEVRALRDHLSAGTTGTASDLQGWHGDPPEERQDAGRA
ncbi:potassium channel family protein [Cellulomonas sp. URHE0023]|uniref:potassium channel family protein n=1 Tax=Cellulomonas sp. URHE0023 TaxID=1380354 RepID=UPI0018CC5399|nr:potassium channel family protein [Cellulomonas sp. URHE0023]